MFISNFVDFGDYWYWNRSNNQFLYKFNNLSIIYLYSYVLKLQDEINIKWDYTLYTIAMFK